MRKPNLAAGASTQAGGANGNTGLTADYGRVTGNWTPSNNAWTNLQTYMIPSASQQPGQSAYNASSRHVRAGGAVSGRLPSGAELIGAVGFGRNGDPAALITGTTRWCSSSTS